MSTWHVQRVTPGWGWSDIRPVMLENATASTSRLQRGGVKLENRVYAPVYREGQPYQTVKGDRIRIEVKVVQADGSVDTVVREAIDTGRSVPQYVESTRSESYGITDEERAQGDEIRAQYNQQVFEQNLAANYTQPYAPMSESAPDFGYSPYDSQYAENAPIAQSESVYVPPVFYSPDVPVASYNSGTGTGHIEESGEPTDTFIQPTTQVTDPYEDWLAYTIAIEQIEAYGWEGVNPG